MFIVIRSWHTRSNCIAVCESRAGLALERLALLDLVLQGLVLLRVVGLRGCGAVFICL